MDRDPSSENISQPCSTITIRSFGVLKQASYGPVVFCEDIVPGLWRLGLWKVNMAFLNLSR